MDADLKTLNGNHIRDLFSNAKKQGNKIVVFKIESLLTIEIVKRQLKGQINLRKENPFKRIFIIIKKDVWEY